jgi:endonuclease/exonuclease/phosphatase family metal-dependent hydrolase
MRKGRKIIRALFFIFSSVILLLYFLCCLSVFIPPSSFSYSIILSILFPFVLIAAVCCCIAFFLVNKKIALILCVVVVAAGATGFLKTVAFNRAGQQAQKPNGSTRVMTWNVHQFVEAQLTTDGLAKAKLKMIGLVKTYNPDILCLQEYKDRESNQNTIIIKKELAALGFVYSFVSADVVLDKVYGYEFMGTAIFSKIPIADSGKISLAQQANENMVFADFVQHNRRFRVYTAHLVSFSLYSDALEHGHYKRSLDKETVTNFGAIQHRLRNISLQHEQEAAIIKNNISESPYPVIFCGDINEVPVSYIYRQIRAGLQDAFLQKGAGLGRTFFKLAPNLRIDVCLLDKKFDVLQYNSPEVVLSDHFPIICDFAWNKN